MDFHCVSCSSGCILIAEVFHSRNVLKIGTS
jgi:hypothetical protein